MRTKLLMTSTAVAAALMLTGCLDGDDDTPSNPMLKGTAAVGAPIVGGTVNVVCAGGSALTATTSNDGAWQVTTSGQTLPCAVKVSSGTVGGSANTTAYHSIALDFGTVNITPLTDLAIANLSGQTPSVWFSSIDAAKLKSINAAALNAAVEKIKTSLSLSTTLNGANPISSNFQAVNGNLMDDVLEALKTAMAAAGLNYNALLALASQAAFNAPEGFNFASAYQTVTNTGGNSGGGTGGTTACTSTETQVTFDLANGISGSPYTDGQKVCVVASTTQLKIAGKTLTNPVRNTVVTEPYSAYVFADGSYKYEVVFNNGQLHEINLNDASKFYGQFAATGSGDSGGSTGGGSGSQPGLTLSKSIGSTSSLANSTGSSTTQTNPDTQVVTHKAQWGDMLNTMLVIAQHAIVTNVAGASYESLTINIAKASPLLSAQIENGTGGVCILNWTSGTMPSSFKLCSTFGVGYDRTTGTVTFNNTPMIDLVGGNGKFTISGGLNFTPY